MKKILLITLPVWVLFAACNQESEQSAGVAEKPQIEVDEVELKAYADLITATVQEELLANVTSAVQEGGFAHAVEFCNVEAIPLTEGTVSDFRGKVERITDRNRNPNNGLSTETDQAVFAHFQESESAVDSLVFVGNEYIYYKRINLGMPTCLSCHGGSEDLDAGALAKITELYPEDKAQGYSLKELRGAWKVTFPENMEL